MTIKKNRIKNTQKKWYLWCED